MNYNFEPNVPLPVSEAKLAETFTAAMQRVYLWMFLGLMLTAGVATTVVSSPTLLRLVFGSGSTLPFLGLVVVELALVIGISAAINRLTPGVAAGLFFLYAAVNGITLSVIFLAYELGTITLAFAVTAALFGVMSVVGYTTKEDLTRWRGILFMGLIGLIIASVANYFLASTTLDWILTYAGIALFLALTVYDTNRIKAWTYQALVQGDTLVAGRVGVLGALRLYLDFVNLFLYILRLLGRRK
ncbi:MAG: Bax inhibitor-1/YccA family protein [Chloroflexota bacterium]